MSKEKSKYQKILDLLNEYEDPMISRYEKYDEETGFFILNTGQKAREEVILGKTYGFIEWLVENEKIDFENRDLKDKYTEYFERYPYRPYTDFSLEGLIMLLSIQDEPIEFLVSILKDDATEKIDKLLNGAKKTCESLGI